MLRLGPERSYRVRASHRLRSALFPLALGLLFALGVTAIAQTLTVGKADPVRYINDIKALTAPATEGRGDDTKGIEIATKMLEERYKSLGLTPAGTNGYRQAFSVVTGAKLVSTNSMHEQVG